MKSEKIIWLSFILLQFNFAQESFAQSCFTDATNVELSVGYGLNPPSGSVTHTGNDARTGILPGNTSTNMRIQVWDGDYPGIYGYDGGACLVTLLPSGITDPDVVLMERSTYPYWYALIVYADGSGNCFLDLYEWDGSIFNPVTGSIYPYQLENSNSVASKYSTAINIDMDENGNFCIVWDDVESENIMALGGYIYNDEPVLCGSPTSVVIADGSQYQMPDVSLIRRSCSVVPPYTCYSRVFFTYVDTGNPNELHVDGDHFEDWICGGGNVSLEADIISIPSVSASSSYFLYPRIACPIFQTQENEWTVVVEVDDPINALSDIVGYNRIGNSVPAEIIFTDASTFMNSCAINDNNSERNQFPVVSYDYSYSGMMVGWESEYSASNLVAKGVIAVTCDQSGQQQSNSCYDNYQIISFDNGFTYHTSALSISGRDYSNGTILYSFYGDDALIYFKDVAYPSCELKKGNFDEKNEVILFPNPFTDHLTINVSDKNENVIFSLKIS